MSPHAHSTSPTYILTDANARDHPKSMLSLFKLTINFLVSTRSTMELLRLATCHSDWSKTSMSVRDTLTLGECVWQVMGHGLHRPGYLKQRADGTGESFEYFFLHPATTLNWSKNVKTWPTTTFASFIPLQMFTTCFSQLERPTSQVWWCLVTWTFVHVVKTIKMVY